MSVLILFLQFLTLFPDGGYLGKPGGFKVVAQTDYASSSKAWNHNQKSYSIARLTDLKLSTGFEYTLSESGRMAAAFTFFSNSKLGSEKSQGVGDGAISFSYGYRPIVSLSLAGTLALRVPFGSPGRLDNPIPSGWDEFQSSFLLSGSWFPFRFPSVSVLMETGATLRGNNKNHEMNAGAGLEYKDQVITARVWNRWKFPLGPINATDAPLTGSANGVSWGMISGNLELQLPADWGLIYSADWYFMLQNMGTPLIQRVAVAKWF